LGPRKTLDCHLGLIYRLWKPYGTVNCSVVKITDAAAGTPDFQLVISIRFENRAGFDRAMDATSAEVMGDLANFTDSAPIILFGDLVAGASCISSARRPTSGISRHRTSSERPLCANSGRSISAHSANLKITSRSLTINQ
jgi:hypothetical protein